MDNQTTSRYTAVSVVITKAQKEAVQAYQRQREREVGGRMAFSEALRELLEAGVECARRSGIMIPDTQNETEGVS